MKINTKKNGLSLQSLLIASAAFMLVMFVGAVIGHAASPPAGTPVGNQAAATYTDSTGTQREATSNVVYTYVQQVGALTLVADRTTIVAPGGQVVFPHTLTNTGNGTDSFSLVVANQGGDNFNLTNLAIYPDFNQDGVPDNYTSITGTGPLVAGGQFNFVIVGNVPGGATSGQTGIVTVNTVSAFDATKTALNTDTAQISNQAVLSLLKALSVTTGNPGSVTKITLTYINTGNNTATNVVVRDTIPAGMTYVTGSARWTVSGATTLTEAAGGDPAGINFEFTSPLAIATVTSVGPGVTAAVSFDVQIDSGLAPQIIPNTANIIYDDGSGVIVGPQNSNTVNYIVKQVAAVVLNDNPLQGGDVTLNDRVEVPTASQGATVVFNNRLHNTGNGTDTFNITVGASTFPAGTSFQLYQADGNTPLVDSNGDGIPDTGPVPAGGDYTIVLKATLPPGATGGPFQSTVTATSTYDNTVSDPVVDALAAIAANSVDLTNNAALPGGLGSGIGAEVAPVVTNTTNPGTTTIFTLFVNNTSTVSDSYDLAASTNATFSSITLPTGWSVVFRDTGNTVVTNTGPIAPGANKQILAYVTVPSNFAAGNVETYFRALSSVSGARDIIHDRVTVSPVHAPSVEPNNTGQVPPGGAVDYTHQVCNNGNVTETITLTVANSAAGWSVVLYIDSNNDGALDSGDAIITAPLVLTAGACQRIFTKVFAPSGAAAGSNNVTTVTGTVATGESDSATDNTTVISSDLSMLKEQSLDAACDGTADGAFGIANITTGALPGACVRYRITVTNNGATPITNVHVFDTTPAFTAREDGGAAPSVTGGTVNTFTGPANGSAGSFDFNVGTLAPGASATITFGVKINN